MYLHANSFQKARFFQRLAPAQNCVANKRVVLAKEAGLKGLS